MTFNSWQFLLFLPITIILNFLLPHKFRWIILLIASYVFYCFWNPALIFLILTTTLVSYVGAIVIEKSNKKPIKRSALIFSLIISFGFLIFFKYINFLIASVIDFLNLFSLKLDSITLNVILPVGISFYTFQTASYVIDVYKGKDKAEKHFGYYALYVSFFPQLVAGPIEKASFLLPQLKEERKFNADNLISGSKIAIIGFLKKICIADVLSIFVNNVFSDLSKTNSLSIYLAGALFMVQMYCDFSAYSEIAMGSARMIGVKLSKNFDEPFLSRSVGEFFRRWHITLNQWLTEYIYIPLGGSRKGFVRRLFNVFIVFTVCGLWHGANWTFLLWGWYCGGFMIIELFLRPWIKKLDDLEGYKLQIVNFLRRCYVFFIVLVPGALMFRAQSVAEIGTIFNTIFTGFNNNFFTFAANNLGINLASTIYILLFILGLYFIDKLCKQNMDFPPVINQNSLTISRSYSEYIMFAAFIVLISLIWVYLSQSNLISEFVYFQF